MIRLLLADDSPFILNSLRRMLAGEPDIEIVGAVESGRSAITFVKSTPVDVLLLDLNMKDLDGVETVREIMRVKPTPIVILTATAQQDPRVIVALQSGAVEMIQKPGGDAHSPFLADIRTRILEQVRMASGANLVKLSQAPFKKPGESQFAKKRYDVILIGVSTGGPSALGRLLSALPEYFDIPIIIVQHISDGYTSGLVRSLQTSCARPVR